jgi:tetratricopeptide (TPR) repeat protein
MAKKRTLKRKATDPGRVHREAQVSTVAEVKIRSDRKSLEVVHWLKIWWVQILAMALATLVCYGHTLRAPFYLDDFSSIAENPLVQTWGDWRGLWDYAPLRIVGYFSFAMNHHFGQFQVVGYHIVNIVIHFLAGCAVLALAKGLMSTPVVRPLSPPDAAQWVPLLTGLLFVIHPLQTQAVTYIVQRLASLAALFYLSALACYVWARVSEKTWQQWLLILGAVLFAGLAFFTKQNTFTLPLTVLLAEVIFFQEGTKRVLGLLAIVVAGLGCLFIVFAVSFGYDPFSLKAMEVLTRETTVISRIQYLATQMKVLWIYIRLFFLPVGLHLDHDVPLLNGLISMETFPFLAGHVIVLVLAIRARKKSPIFSFGVLFYYLAHLVESSFIPIRDVLFEHRAYLPNAGLCLVTGWITICVLPSVFRWLKPAAIALPMVAILGVMTWQRNQLWTDPVALWRDNATKTPNKYRVLDTYAKQLLKAGRTEEAAQVLALTDRFEKGNDIQWPNAINHLIMLRRQGKLEEALATADQYLSKNPNPRIRSKILANKGNIYIEMRDLGKAEASFRKALSVYPENLPAMVNLGIVLFHRGARDEAKRIFMDVLAKDPQQAAARNYLDKLSGS